MSLNSHLSELKRKHDTLSAEVETVQRSPGADTLEIAKMKKQKLQLKQEMERLRS